MKQRSQLKRQSPLKDNPLRNPNRRKSETERRQRDALGKLGDARVQVAKILEASFKQPMPKPVVG